MSAAGLSRRPIYGCKLFRRGNFLIRGCSHSYSGSEPIDCHAGISRVIADDGEKKLNAIDASDQERHIVGIGIQKGSAYSIKCLKYTCIYMQYNLNALVLNPSQSKAKRPVSITYM